MLADALKRLAKHSAIYAIVPAVGSLVGLGLMPLITRVLPLGEYGVKENVEVTIALGAQVLGVNLLHGMTRYWAGYETERERATLVSTSLWLLGALTGAAFALALVFRAELGALLFGSRGETRAAVCVAAILWFQCVGQVGLRYLQVRERSLAYVGITSSKLLLEVALKVGLVALLALTTLGALFPGWLAVVGPVAVVEGLLAAGVVVALARTTGLRFSRAMAARLVRYSWPLVLAGVAAFVLHQGDRYVIVHLRSLAEVGAYGAAYKVGGMVNAFVLSTFGLIWFPYAFSVRDEDALKVVQRKVLTWFAVIAVQASLALAVFSRELLTLFAAEAYRPAHRVIPFVCLGYVMWGLYQVLHTPFYLRERTGRATVLVTVAAGFNLASTALLVPRFGYPAAAWTTAATFSFLAFGAYFACERLLPVGYELGRIAVVLLLGVGLFAASRGVPVDAGVPGLVAKGGLVLGFSLALWLGGFVRPDERGGLRGFLAERRSSVRNEP